MNSISQIWRSSQISSCFWPCARSERIPWNISSSMCDPQNRKTCGPFWTSRIGCCIPGGYMWSVASIHVYRFIVTFCHSFTNASFHHGIPTAAHILLFFVDRSTFGFAWLDEDTPVMAPVMASSPEDTPDEDTPAPPVRSNIAQAGADYQSGICDCRSCSAMVLDLCWYFDT